MKPNYKKLQATLFVAGFFTACYFFLSFMKRNAVNIPYWDEWDISKIITGRPGLSEILLLQHNEHRMGVGMALMKFFAGYTNWSQVFEMKATASMIICATLILIFLKYKFTNKIEILDLIIPVAFLNIFQAENITNGFSFAFVLPFFFLVLWTLTLRIKNLYVRNSVLTLISMLGAHSHLHGILIPVITIFFLTAEFIIQRNYRRLYAWTATANLLIIATYFIGYHNQLQTRLTLNLSLEMLEYISLALSNGFFFQVKSFPINLLIALTVAGFFLIGCVRYYNDRHAYSSLTGITLLTYLLMFATMIAVGRSSFGTEQAASSRYVTFLMLGPAGLYFIFTDLKPGPYLKTVLLAFLLFNTIWFYKKTEAATAEFTLNKRLVLQCYTEANVSKYKEGYAIFKLYPDEKILDSLLPTVLRYKKIVK